MTRSLSHVPQPTRAAVVLLAFTIFGIYLLSSSWRFPLGGDGRATLATSRSLLTHRTLAVDAGFASDEGFGPRARIGVDGRAYAKAGLGLPIIELPFVATGLLMSKVAGLPEAQTLAGVLSLLNPLVSACVAIVVFRLCQTVGCSPLTALLAAIAYAFGTLAWVYAGVDGTEPLQALCLALSLLLLIRYRSERHAWLLSGSGVALAYAIVTKPANGVLVPAFGLYALSALRARRLSLKETVPVLMRFASPLTIGFLFLAWLNWFRFGSVLETGYEPHAFMNHFLDGIYGLIFSFNKGIVFYAPLLVLAPVGMWIMRRSQRGEAMLIAVASLTYISLFAKFYNWGGGWSWGPRYLMPIVPLLMVPVARAAAAPRVWRYAGAGLFIAGLLVNGVGVLVAGDAYHTAIMDVDLTDRTGFVQVGSVADPSRMVEMPVPPDYVLPEFSEIVGKLWLAGVAWDGCSCDEQTAECGCRAGDLEKNARFSSPPWMRRYPQIHPLPPYGSRLINPWIADRIHRSFMVKPSASSEHTSRGFFQTDDLPGLRSCEKPTACMSRNTGVLGGRSAGSGDTAVSVTQSLRTIMGWLDAGADLQSRRKAHGRIDDGDVGLGEVGAGPSHGRNGQRHRPGGEGARVIEPRQWRRAGCRSDRRARQRTAARRALAVVAGRRNDRCLTLFDAFDDQRRLDNILMHLSAREA